MNDKPILYILTGNIGSGKTTQAKKYRDRGCVILSRDSFRYALGGGKYLFDYDIEPIIQEIVQVSFMELLELKVDILIDELNTTIKTRKEYIKLAKKHKYNIIGVIMPSLNKEESVKRRMTNNHGDTSEQTWELVWDRFNRKFQPPTLKEGFDRILEGGFN